MSSKITKAGLVGLLSGVGLALFFPPLGPALVIAGAVGGAALGHALDEEEKEEEEQEKLEEGVDTAEHLLNEFDAWDRRLTSQPPSNPRAAASLHAPAASPAPATEAQRTRVSSPRVSSLYSQVAAAEALLKEGRLLEAIDGFRKIKDSLLEATSGAGPSDRQRVIDGLRLALQRLAGVLIENDSPAEAEELLKESLELAPGDLETLLHLSRLQMMLNQPQAAEPYLRSALELHASSPEPYRLLADIYIEEGRLDEARALFRQAVDEVQDTALTIEMLERISGLDPEDPMPLIELGKAQAQDANLEEAGRAYRQALLRAPGNSYIRRKLGALCLKLGRTAEGVQLLEDVAGLQEDIEALGELAHYYAASEDDVHALPLLREMRTIDRDLQKLDPVERRSRLRDIGMEGDQVDARYAPLRVRSLLDFAAVETRSGSVAEAESAAIEAFSYGGSRLGVEALEVATKLATEFDRQGEPESSKRWAEETSRLGGSLERVRLERDTYEEFLRRFRYSAQDLIAEGGMARVYRGTDTRSSRTVAIKRMHDRFCTDPQAVAYFYREVRALEELSRPHPHPNIVEFIASGITETRFIFAMEYVEGPSLRQIMERGEVLSLEDLCRLLEGICAGLDRAHNSVRSIIHRDLKPENILLSAERTPKLTDFGIARVSSLFSASRRYYGSTQSFVGTSLYSAPEQYPDPYSGQVPAVDARADIYSLGCIAYELLTTQPPFLAADPGLIGLMHQRRPLPGAGEPQPLPLPSERNPLAMQLFPPEVRSRLDAIVMRCLELKPSRRYRSARALMDELESLRLTGADADAP